MAISTFFYSFVVTSSWTCFRVVGLFNPREETHSFPHIVHSKTFFLSSTSSVEVTASTSLLKSTSSSKKAPSSSSYISSRLHLTGKHYFPQPFCKNFMQDHRADVYILTWARKTIGNGPSFQTIPVSYDYGPIYDNKVFVLMSSLRDATFTWYLHK